MAMSRDHRRIRLRLLFVPFVLLLTCAGAGPLAAQATFARTGDMTVGRNLPAATLLNDGRVLVTGGTRFSGSNYVINKEAEIYDPNTGAFSATGSMSVPRIRHGAVRLNDGRVLVLGGQPDANAGTFSDSAELFDPAAGTFKPTGSLLHPRFFATTTLLKDGRVLVAGGYSANANFTPFVATSSEIYDPAAGKFVSSGDMAARREEHTAVALLDGRVLVFGGSGASAGAGAGAGDRSTGGSVSPLQVELFDPASGTFSTIGQLNEGRQNASATLLPDGKVLVAGGFVLMPDGGTAISSNTVEVFDPATGKSTIAGTMSEGRAFHAAVALADGRVLLAGGTAGVNGDHSTASADLFDPKTGKITPAPALVESRTQAAAVRLLDGRVLIVGGARIAEFLVAARLQTAEIYTP